MPALLRRLLLAPIPRLVWTALLVRLLVALLVLFGPALAGASNLSFTGSVRNAAFALFVFTVCLWLFERKRPRDVGLGLTGAVPQTAYGFLVGALLLTAVTGVLALVGSYQLLGWAAIPEGTTRGTLFARMVLLFLAVGIFEEVAVRGIIFRQLEQALGTWLALLFSALFFGFIHRGNPGATWVSSVAIALEAGVLLGAAYVATRSLWVPIGLHWSWNLFEGPVWGSPVSGNDVSVLAHARFPGPAFLTGGEFGPEAGLPAMVLGGALGVWFIVLAIRRQQIMTPAWMWWVAGRLRRQRPEPVEPAPTPAPATPSNGATA